MNAPFETTQAFWLAARHVTPFWWVNDYQEPYLNPPCLDWLMVCVKNNPYGESPGFDQESEFDKHLEK